MAIKIFIGCFVLIWIFSACKMEKANHDYQTQTHEFRIAYNVYAPDSLNDDNYEIFTMKIDGSDKRNITNHPDVAWTYLAHEDKIFFISDRDTISRNFFLYQMDYLGKNIKQITNFRLKDSWMGIRKNGSELIVVPHSTVDSMLYLISINGEIIEKINPGTPSASNPVFSPDGMKIAFVGSNKSSKREKGYEEEIYVVNVDGTELSQLTTYPKIDTTAEWYAYKAGPPRWHPTENFISYQSKQNGKYSLYAVNPDGQKNWKMTQNTEQEGWHCWSSDGQWLAIELFNEDESQFHIGLMNWNTKKLKILTDTSYKYQQAPVFLEI